VCLSLSRCVAAIVLHVGSRAKLAAFAAVALVGGLCSSASASTYVSQAETALGFDIGDGTTEVLTAAGVLFAIVFGVIVVMGLARRAGRLLTRVG